MKKVLSVSGMSCSHCAAHVEESLLKVPGVKKVKVNLKKGEAVVVIQQPIADEVFINSLKETDYKVEGVK
jgi:copper chaperone CopZ